MELNLEMTQRTVLSSKMIQSAEVLQMSSQELEDFLKKAEAENPVIDFAEYPREERAVPNVEFGRKLPEFSYGTGENYSSHRVEHNKDEEDKTSWENYAFEDQTLNKYLVSQLGTLKVSKKDVEVLNYMISSIDSKGFLREPIENMPAVFHISLKRTEKLLKILQSFEPAGVGARNLSECLRIQLIRQNVKDPVLYRLVEEYLEDIGKNRLQQIAKTLNISVDQIAKRVSIIRNLNPMPGNGFCSGESIRYVIPDVIVRNGNGMNVILNEEYCPDICLNSYYLRLREESNEAETKSFLDKKIKQAEWLKQCIKNRNLTLLKVAGAIVKRQESFFLMGSGKVRPMTLSDIAQDINVHVSTVSRTVNEKYLECSFGVFPLKYFFKHGITGDGDTVCPSTVKEKITDIINNENRKKPFSDNQIAELLNKSGIVISRRTVTKYREEMLINNAGSRKEF